MKIKPKEETTMSDTAKEFLRVVKAEGLKMVKKQEYTVMVNCNLEYTYNVSSVEDAKQKAEDENLPDEYVSESFEIVKVIDEEGNEY